MGLSGTISDYLELYQTIVQVEAGESKFIAIWKLFGKLINCAISRGARAPKNEIRDQDIGK